MVWAPVEVRPRRGRAIGQTVRRRRTADAALVVLLVAAAAVSSCEGDASVCAADRRGVPSVSAAPRVAAAGPREDVWGRVSCSSKKYVVPTYNETATVIKMPTHRKWLSGRKKRITSVVGYAAKAKERIGECPRGSPKSFAANEHRVDGRTAGLIWVRVPAMAGSGHSDATNAGPNAMRREHIHALTW